MATVNGGGKTCGVKDWLKLFAFGALLLAPPGGLGGPLGVSAGPVDGSRQLLSANEAQGKGPSPGGGRGGAVVKFLKGMADAVANTLNPKPTEAEMEAVPIPKPPSLRIPNSSRNKPVRVADYVTAKNNHTKAAANRSVGHPGKFGAHLP